MKQRLLAVFLLIGVIAMPSSLVLGGEEAATRSRYLAGQFLVAAPKMADPRFKRTVIYMIAHDAEGAMGLIVNRPFGSGRLSALMEGFGVKEPIAKELDGDVRLHYGGPVQQGRGFILHSSDYKDVGTTIVSGDVSMTSRVEVLMAIAEGKGPKHSLFILGYAGWGAGQLENEMARQDWTTAPAELDMIFSDDPESVWRKVSKVSGLEL